MKHWDEIQALEETIKMWGAMRKVTEEQFKKFNGLTTLKDKIMGSAYCPLCAFYKECDDCILASRTVTYADYKNCDEGNLYADVSDDMFNGQHDYKKYIQMCEWIIGCCQSRQKILREDRK